MLCYTCIHASIHTITYVHALESPSGSGLLIICPFSILKISKLSDFWMYMNMLVAIFVCLNDLKCWNYRQLQFALCHQTPPYLFQCCLSSSSSVVFCRGKFLHFLRLLKSEILVNVSGLMLLFSYVTRWQGGILVASPEVNESPVCSLYVPRHVIWHLSSSQNVLPNNSRGVKGYQVQSEEIDLLANVRR